MAMLVAVVVVVVGVVVVVVVAVLVVTMLVVVRMQPKILKSCDKSANLKHHLCVREQKARTRF